jgi:hypothetical protein
VVLPNTIDCTLTRSWVAIHLVVSAVCPRRLAAMTDRYQRAVKSIEHNINNA